MISYKRQSDIAELNVPESATVIGTGAIGSWVAYLSAMAGVKRLIIYSIGVVKPTDLARLPFFAHHEGMHYNYALSDLIYAVRPDIALELYGEYLPGYNLEGIVFNCATNNTPDFDKIIFQHCQKNNLRYITGGYNKSSVYVSDHIAEDGPVTRLGPCQRGREAQH